MTVAEVATDAAPPDDDTTASTTAPTKRRRGFGSVFMEYAILVTVAITLALLIRGFLGLVFWIPSVSMVPTFKVDDRVVVSRLSYRLHDVHRSDIVVFQNPRWKHKQATFPLNLVSDLGEFVGVGQDRDKIFIKRVIGLPGETVSGKDGHVYINGVQLAEPYLVAGVVTDDFPPYKVPPGRYFMMGDNRSNSCDSRCFTDTTGAKAPFIAQDKIVGRAFLRIWPFSRIGKP